MNTLQLLALVGAFLLNLAVAEPAFSGNFLILDLIVDSPYQADATNTTQSSVEFSFSDEDTPEVPATHCYIHWAVGLTPSTADARSSCSNKSFGALIPDESYHGFANFMLNLSHSYIDNSVGDYPYNVLSKFGHIEFAYINTTNYDCDLAGAHCESCNGTTIVVPVSAAIG